MAPAGIEQVGSQSGKAKLRATLGEDISWRYTTDGLALPINSLGGSRKNTTWARKLVNLSGGIW
jgi:hypothetical protein